MKVVNILIYLNKIYRMGSTIEISKEILCHRIIYNKNLLTLWSRCLLLCSRRSVLGAGFAQRNSSGARFR